MRYNKYSMRDMDKSPLTADDIQDLELYIRRDKLPSSISSLTELRDRLYKEGPAAIDKELERLTDKKKRMLGQLTLLDKHIEEKKTDVGTSSSVRPHNFGHGWHYGGRRRTTKRHSNKKRGTIRRR